MDLVTDAVTGLLDPNALIIFELNDVLGCVVPVLDAVSGTLGVFLVPNALIIFDSQDTLGTGAAGVSRRLEGAGVNVCTSVGLFLNTDPSLFRRDDNVPVDVFDVDFGIVVEGLNIVDCTFLNAPPIVFLKLDVDPVEGFTGFTVLGTVETVLRVACVTAFARDLAILEDVVLELFETTADGIFRATLETTLARDLAIPDMVTLKKYRLKYFQCGI